MKPVEELLEAARATLTTSSPTLATAEPQQTELSESERQGRKAVSRIFATLKIAFPAWYEKHFGEDLAEQMGRRVWLVSIAGISDEAIDKGLHRMVVECKFPPSPSDFLELCNRVEGMPSEQQAWLEALQGNYSHEVCKYAAIVTGTFDLRQSTADNKSLRERFNRNYAIVRARAVMGKPLDASIPEGIEHETKTPMQVQLAASHQQARDLITAQGLPTDPKQARALLLAKMGIKREQSHA